LHLTVNFCVSIPELPTQFGQGWEGFIVGGSNAASGQFPYQVSLRSAANSHFCGGSIINSRWALSAAHCTIGRTTANTRVVVGTHLLNSGGISHTTSAIVNHPSYNANTLANDISVVQTAAAIGFTNLAQPMGLASAFTGGGITATASGWGQTSVSVRSDGGYA
jgi:trypsin